MIKVTYLLLIACLYSCQLTIPYAEDVKYLEIDYVHDTPEKKKKFKELKQMFLKTWRDTSNCYIERAACKSCPTPVHTAYIKEISVTNILHTPKYDTLLVLVTWYSAEYKENGELWQDRTVGIGMGILKDSLSNIVFSCNAGTYKFQSSNDGNRIEEFEYHLKRLVIKAGYLREDKTPDPTFFHRVYTDPNMWHKDDKSLLQKLIEKIPFPGNVERD